MAQDRKSYRSPYYADLATRAEQAAGLPSGLLTDIVTRGERSNADQVSEAGARTVFQITPQTRKLAIKAYGVDPYLSDENAAEVAARLLKDSLDRNGGDVGEAVGEYHGGTDRSNWGPRTRAYVKRVTGRSAASIPPEAKPVVAATQGPPPVPQRVLNALASGEMTPAEEAALRKAVVAKQVALPEGYQLPAPTDRAAKPNATVIPARVLQNYNSHSDMTDGQRDLIDRDLSAGLLKLPDGGKLQRPPPRTAADQLGMGVRAVGEGLASVPDFVASAVNGPINVASELVTGKPLVPTGAVGENVTAAADALNLAKAGTPGEKLLGSVLGGAASAVGTMGLAAPLRGAQGATGAIARGLTSAPVSDIVSSAAATGAQEAARQAGAGPIAQLGAALAAGGTTAVGAAGAARKVAPAIAERIGPKAVKAIEETPPEVLVDAAGDLTEEGVEAAVRAKTPPEEFKAAVQQFREGVNDNAVQARDAGQAPPRDVAVGQSEFVDTITPRRRGSQQPPEAVAPVREADVAPAPVQAVPEAPGGPAAARVAEAESLGVPLTRGQATQDFATQADEQALLAAQSPEGQAARDFKVKQQEALQGATTRFQEAIGDATLTAEERGQALKASLEAMRDQGKAGVTALYSAARQSAEQLGEQLGDNAKAVLDLPTGGIKARVREILLDDTVDDAVRTGLRQQAAKYGLIGENPRTFEDGTTSVTIKAPGGAETRTITFDGAPEPLSVLNAEAFRKKLNGLYAKDTSGALGSLKGLIDDAVEEAVERAAREFESAPGNVGEQYRAARSAHRVQKETFDSKDGIAKLLEVKRGTSETPAVPASRAVKALLDGPIEDLRKAKAIILSSPDPVFKAGWEGVRAQAIADLFAKAWTTNANAGGGMIGQLSGAKLRSEIARVGAPKLKVLLGDEDFNQLMKIQRVAGDATIPISGTVNTSNSANALIRFIGKNAARLSPLLNAVPGVGAVKAVADVGANVVQGAKEAAKSKAVLEGVQNFTPEAAQAVDAAALAPEKAKANPVQFISDYLAAAKADRLIAPLVATTASQGADQ